MMLEKSAAMKSAEINGLLKFEKQKCQKLESELDKLKSDYQVLNSQYKKLEEIKEENEKKMLQKNEDCIKEITALHQREISELKYLLNSALHTNELCLKTSNMNISSPKKGSLREALKNADDKISELQKINSKLSDENYTLSQELEHIKFSSKYQEFKASPLEKEFDHYLERKCKTLSDMVLYWKEQTTQIYEKSRQNIGIIKTEHENVILKIEGEMEKIREEHTKNLLTAKTEYMTVIFFI